MGSPATAVHGRAHPLAKIFWVVAMLGALLGGFIGIGGALLASGAPQEAAAAGIGCLVAMVPYVFARSIDELTRK